MFQMPESLPEPTSTKTRNGKYGYHQQVQRDVTTTWVLNPESEGVPQIRVTLTTSHGESWMSYQKTSGYSSTMTWSTFEPAEPGSVFSVETWSSDNAMKRVVPMVVVPRHSLKAMEAAHAAALAEVAERFSHFAYIFEQAATKSGLTEMAEA
jgi:hypothetical protein